MLSFSVIFFVASTGLIAAQGRYDIYTSPKSTPDNFVCKIRNGAYRTFCISEQDFIGGLGAQSIESFVTSLDLFGKGLKMGLEMVGRYGEKTVGQILEGIHQSRQKVKADSPSLAPLNHFFRSFATLYNSSVCEMMVEQFPLQEHFYQNYIDSCSSF